MSGIPPPKKNLGVLAPAEPSYVPPPPLFLSMFTPLWVGQNRREQQASCVSAAAVSYVLLDGFPSESDQVHHLLHGRDELDQTGRIIFESVVAQMFQRSGTPRSLMTTMMTLMMMSRTPLPRQQQQQLVVVDICAVSVSDDWTAGILG